MKVPSPRSPLLVLTYSFFALTLATSALGLDSGTTSKEKGLYDQLKAFSLTGGVVDVKGVVLKRVRAQITPDGVVYLSEPVDGVSTGAVFIGEGIAKKYGMTDLNWLFYQSVYQTALPSYEMQYKIEDQPDGKVVVSGRIVQENAPADWVMVLPVKFSFGARQEALGTVLVQGPSSPFQIRLPMRPKKVELDPARWILSERISTKGN